MAEIVRMPKLSDTMTEGVVAEWHKKVGDSVDTGDLLAEIETDKATMEFESFQEGVLLHIGVQKGETAPVDSILAILGEKGEDVSKILEDEKNSAAQEAKEEQKADSAPAEKQAAPEVVQAPTAKKETASPSPQKVVEPQVVVTHDSSIKASPLAKRLATERNINLSFVKGTGDGGRIIKRDIEQYSGGSNSVLSQVERFDETPVSQMRKTIARRLSESKFDAPHFYLTIDINMDKVWEARKAVNEVAPVKISFNDFVIKAAAVALIDHPQVNSSWLGDKIRTNYHVHIGVAVAVTDGLLVPVIRFADGKRLSQISMEVKDLATKAKEKKLQPSEWEGNTFTISNLGMFGIEEFTAIINPPDACIMAVGAIRDEAIVNNGEIVAAKMMKVTMSCDHRVVDGATGSAFLNTFKNLLENPIVLLGKQSI
ncbi:MAG: pyruvate dehydrogenase complex dihydrolipoamide acetyltransferase [Flavobacteriales bacterium]|nr:pyruvate dehydrogenase complex dihydrolipoamide acetyltransferase [Flavobacteriales bacterium]